MLVRSICFFIIFNLFIDLSPVFPMDSGSSNEHDLYKLIDIIPNMKHGSDQDKACIGLLKQKFQLFIESQSKDQTKDQIQEKKERIINYILEKINNISLGRKIIESIQENFDSSSIKIKRESQEKEFHERKNLIKSAKDLKENRLGHQGATKIQHSQILQIKNDSVPFFPSLNDQHSQDMRNPHTIQPMQAISILAPKKNLSEGPKDDEFEVIPHKNPEDDEFQVIEGPRGGSHSDDEFLVIPSSQKK